MNPAVSNQNLTQTFQQPQIKPLPPNPQKSIKSFFPIQTLQYMKKYRSISIPEKLPSVYKFKRSIQNTSNRSRVYSSLPSSLTQELFHLQQENHELRSRLKDISAKLSHLIESNRYSVKSRSTPDPRPTLNLEIVKKNLFYYE